MSEPAWVVDAVFYQIFPDRFCNGDPSNDPAGVEPWGALPTRSNWLGGDLQGIIARLGYLQDLGINALYLNPVFRARTNHRYDTCDYFQVDPILGSNAVLKALVAEAHRRSMRVILDGVFNHCGDGFWAFEDLVARGPASPYADWFHVRSYPISAADQSYYTCGGAPYLPKLNLDHPPVQEYILKVACYWLQEAGIDGWRLDVPFKVPFAFWRKFRRMVKAINPDAYLVGEVWREAAPWVQGDIFDGTTNYRLRELILDYVATSVLDAEDFAFEVEMLTQAHGAAAPTMLNLLGSHDTPRILTVLNGDVNRLLIALTFLMTTTGAPLVYYGDEVGLPGGADPDCRRAMEWDPARWNMRIHRAYRRLIALRHAHPALRRGRTQKLFTFEGVYAYRRVYAGDEVVVILNPRSSLRNVILPLGGAVVWRDAFTGQEHVAIEGEIRLDCVAAHSFTLLVPADQVPG